MNDRGLNGTKPVAQASAEEAQLAETQRRDDNIDLEVSQPQAPSNIEQLQANANGDEAINLDDTTTSGAAVGCHQIDSPLKCAQTDASASLPDTQVTHKSNEMAHSRQLAKVAPDHAVMRLISSADGSAGKLVNTLAAKFPLSFRDEARFDGRRVKLMKRAQIFVADLWAAFNMRGPGDFGDIDHLTMFPGTSMRVQQANLCMQCGSDACSSDKGCSEANVSTLCRLSRCADVARLERALLQSSA